MELVDKLQKFKDGLYMFNFGVDPRIALIRISRDGSERVIATIEHDGVRMAARMKEVFDNLEEPLQTQFKRAIMKIVSCPKEHVNTDVINLLVRIYDGHIGDVDELIIMSEKRSDDPPIHLSLNRILFDHR